MQRTINILSTIRDLAVAVAVVAFILEICIVMGG